MTKLHLITQDNQPYGSTRRCCEECGLSQSEIQGESDNAYFVCDRELFTKKFADKEKMELCS